MKNFNQFVNESANNGLRYCKKCHFLLDGNDKEDCKMCQVLDIIGITKETDNDNIYGKMKYYIRFKKEDLQKYLNELTQKYDLSVEQINKIKELVYV